MKLTTEEESFLKSVLDKHENIFEVKDFKILRMLVMLKKKVQQELAKRTEKYK